MGLTSIHYLTPYRTERYHTSMKYFSIVLSISLRMRMKLGFPAGVGQSVGHLFKGSAMAEPFLVLRTMLEVTSYEF